MVSAQWNHYKCCTLQANSRGNAIVCSRDARCCWYDSSVWMFYLGEGLQWSYFLYLRFKATYSAFKLYIFCQYVCSLGIEPMTFALLTQCSTTEPQEHYFKCTSGYWGKMFEDCRGVVWIWPEMLNAGLDNPLGGNVVPYFSMKRALNKAPEMRCQGVHDRW